MQWLADYIAEYIAKNVKTAPSDFKLEQNYPNPFNLTTNITFSMTAPAKISLKIYDILGRPVATLINNILPADDYTVSWDGTYSTGARAASGIYFYSLVADNSIITTKKMLLIK